VGDFLAFRRMLLPLLIQLIFWLGVLACIGAGVYVILTDASNLTTQLASAPTFLTWAVIYVTENKLNAGLILIIGGPIVLRLFFELILLPFRINATLTEIRRALIIQNQKPAVQAPVSHPAPLEPGAPVRVRR
jgi:hypothetical protein